MPTRINLGEDRYLMVEWATGTGLAEFTETTGTGVAERLHITAGSFDEIADQIREVIDHAKAEGWMTPNQARHGKALVTRTVKRQKDDRRATWRVQ